MSSSSSSSESDDIGASWISTLEVEDQVTAASEGGTLRSFGPRGPPVSFLPGRCGPPWPGRRLEDFVFKVGALSKIDIPGRPHV